MSRIDAIQGGRPVVAAPTVTRLAPSASSATSSPAQVDRADISAEGYAALAAHEAATVASTPPRLSILDADMLGQRLAALDPRRFARADTNHDGRLSPAEARADGLP